MLDIRTMDLRKVNSLTKYPSIETFHHLEAGILTDEADPIPQREIYASEKIDGTNTRIICFPDGRYLIGSREEFLHFRCDLLFLPALGIVEAVRPVAERLADRCWDLVTVFFGETYGGRIQSARSYTASEQFGFRLCDALMLTETELQSLSNRSNEEIARWRDGGGQRFLSVIELRALAEATSLELVPHAWKGPASALPTSLTGMAEFLAAQAPATRCRLDAGDGRAEGLVLRTADRSWIRKVRFEDYERTFRKRSVQGREPGRAGFSPTVAARPV